LKISDLEYIFGMSANPLAIEDYDIYLICHPQLPNSKQKKIAIKFTDKDGDGFDVYDYDNDVEYINTKGQFSTSIGTSINKEY
jgi:hypothetical protein